MVKKPSNNFMNVGNKAMVRPETLCFGKYYDDKGVYGMGFDGTTKLYVPEKDPGLGRKLQQQVSDAVMSCGDGNARISLPDYGFIALDVIERIEIWDDEVVIKNNIDGKVVQRFSLNDYESLETVMDQLNQAMNSAPKRSPYQVDWASLAVNQDELEDERDKDGEDVDDNAAGQQKGSASTPVNGASTDNPSGAMAASTPTNDAGGSNAKAPVKALAKGAQGQKAGF